MLNIATKNTDPQLSPRLFDNLAFQPIVINGDMQKLALLDQHIQTILKIGDLEHTGDWDPYLRIHTKTETFYTATGYPEIIFGDFNEEEQDTAIRHHDEITQIGVYVALDEDEDDIEIQYIPTENIIDILLLRD